MVRVSGGFEILGGLGLLVPITRRAAAWGLVALLIAVLGLRVRIHVWLLFEPSDERACPLERQVEIIDTEEQQEAVAGYCVIGAHQ